MTRTFLKTLAFAGIAALPVIGNAAQPMDSCVNAFMQSMSKHSTPLKLNGSHLVSTAMTPGALMSPASNELVLTATDAHDNHTVARAICRLDSHGQMMELEEVPARALLPLD